MPYHHKTSQPYAEFIVRERGIAAHPTLTIELDSTYSQAFVDALKATLAHGTERAWSVDLKRWFIAPMALNKAMEVATQFFRNVYLVEGEKHTDILSGKTYTVEKLF